MFSDAELKAFLGEKSTSRKDKILALLSVTNKDARQVSQIQTLAVAHGLREAKKWNISQVLRSLSGLAVRIPDGWEITDAGVERLSKLGLVSYSPSRQYRNYLRQYACSISSEQANSFVLECIGALESGLLRSAVVLSWTRAVALLYDEVIDKNLSSFNLELKRRSSKAKEIKSFDELATIKEFDFLQILCSLGIVGKNVKHELESCLRLRNACAHPNSLVLGEHRVASHLEVLILNVYKKFVL